MAPWQRQSNRSSGWWGNNPHWRRQNNGWYDENQGVRQADALKAHQEAMESVRVSGAQVTNWWERAPPPVDRTAFMKKNAQKIRLYQQLEQPDDGHGKATISEKLTVLKAQARGQVPEHQRFQEAMQDLTDAKTRLDRAKRHFDSVREQLDRAKALDSEAQQHLGSVAAEQAGPHGLSPSASGRAAGVCIAQHLSSMLESAVADGQGNISLPISEFKNVVEMAVGPSSSPANSPTAHAPSSDWDEFSDMHEAMKDELEDPSDDDLRSALQLLANGARTSPEIKRRIVRFATRDPYGADTREKFKPDNAVQAQQAMPVGTGPSGEVIDAMVQG